VATVLQRTLDAQESAGMRLPMAEIRDLLGSDRNHTLTDNSSFLDDLSGDLMNNAVENDVFF
jgi:hypothetical protein